MKLKDNLILRKVGTDYMIVQPTQGVADLTKVFNLNQTAAYIWENLQNKDFSLEDVQHLLTSRYEVSSEQALKDAQALIAEFKDQNLFSEQ